MLDLNQVSRFLPGMSQHLRDEAKAAQKRLDRARSLLTQANQTLDQLCARHQQEHDRLAFTAAYPIEPLDTHQPIAPPPAQHTVLATDGSQISPSHHEIAYCYLINVGRIALHYQQNRHPRLDSIPEVIYKGADLQISRQWGISTELWMGHRRTVAEAIALAELAATDQAAIEPKISPVNQPAPAPSIAPEPNVVTPTNSPTPPPTSPPAHPTTHPPATNQTQTLAMVDGSLIYWFLDTLPNEARDYLLSRLLEAWDRLAALRVPLVGYLSASRSSEAVNFLRLAACPHPAPNCLHHCPPEVNQTRSLDCGVFEPLRDTTLWATLLQPGERGCLWRSSSQILQHYGDRQRVYFCYVHVGSEIARIDLPAWVAEDVELREFALGAMLAQVKKGYGYPVALAEAHNQAVVRSGDRQRFFALLEQQLIKAGLKNVGTSYKESRKRRSIT